MTSLLQKVDTIDARDASLQGKLDQQAQEMSLSRRETLETISRVRRIDSAASSTDTQLKDLASGQQLHRQHTISLEERISDLNDKVISKEQLLQMLLSKPAYLKSWHDLLTENGFDPETEGDPTLNTKSSQKKRTPYACGCYRRRRLTRTYSNWSVLSFFDEVVTETKHDLGCPAYSERQITRERTVGVTYTGLHRLLNIAVAASFRHVRGAGGSSISPMFRYYATVDADSSPAYRVVQAIARGIWYMYDSLSSEQEDSLISERESRVNMIIEYGIRKLRGIYQQRAASPTDLDPEGATLVAYVAYNVRCCPQYWAFDSFVLMLPA